MDNKHALLFAVVAAVSNVAQANLITNGGFESGNLIAGPAADSMQLFAGNSTSIFGWTVSAGPDIAWLGPNNPWGTTSVAGGRFLDLTGWHDKSANGGGVNQTINTVAGHRYSLGRGRGKRNPRYAECRAFRPRIPDAW